jgi:hypothetical protein
VGKGASRAVPTIQPSVIFIGGHANSARIRALRWLCPPYIS